MANKCTCGGGAPLVLGSMTSSCRALCSASSADAHTWLVDSCIEVLDHPLLSGQSLGETHLSSTADTL